MMTQTDTRRVVVTGVSSGLGRALALRLGGEGWRVLGAARDAERVRAYEWPAEVVIEELDLIRPETIETFVSGLSGRSAPDVLINNADALRFDPIETYA